MILIDTFVAENLVCENLNWNYWAINSLRTVCYALKVAITFLLILLFDECLLHKDDIFKIMARLLIHSKQNLPQQILRLPTAPHPDSPVFRGQEGSSWTGCSWRDGLLKESLRWLEEYQTDFYIKYGRLLFNLLRSIMVGINFALPLTSCCQNLFCLANLSVI